MTVVATGAILAHIGKEKKNTKPNQVRLTCLIFWIGMVCGGLFLGTFILLVFSNETAGLKWLGGAIFDLFAAMGAIPCPPT